MPDVIPPPVAHRPDAACTLVSAALSDGDLDAALAQYEPEAAASLADGRIVRGRTALRQMLAAAAAGRRLYAVDDVRVLEAGDLALVHGTWWSTGAAESRAAMGYAGAYLSTVRRAADGTWRIVLEAIVLEEDPG